MTGSPQDEAQLLAMAQTLAGMTLSEVATRVGFAMPAHGARQKGVIGELVERALDAPRSTQRGPDFPCGVELKTIPIQANGTPRESTFVAMVSTVDLERPWEESNVYAKLRRVLFVPVEATETRPFPDRRIGLAFMWSPSAGEELILQHDWNELAEQTLLHGDIDARVGRALQIRPKGRNALDTTRRHDVEGAPSRVMKRAFYMRASFTREVLIASGLQTTSKPSEKR
jgi:DNA mismatch repair protein MutH